MIQLENINRYYGTLHVVRNVNLTLDDGGITAIVGPSGAGKTTLLQIAGTLDAPTSGHILYDGVDITRLSDRKLSAFRNANIGFIFQQHRILPEFTAEENVAMPALIAGQSMRTAKQQAAELLNRLGLADRRSHKPGQLSGGECQRVAIARALINSPKVIFADEPTGSLDSCNRDEIQQLLLRLRTEMGQTIILVTHDPTLASIADRVITMRDGSIIEEKAIPTTPDDLDNPSTDSET